MYRQYNGQAYRQSIVLSVPLVIALSVLLAITLSVRLAIVLSVHFTIVLSVLLAIVLSVPLAIALSVLLAIVDNTMAKRKRTKRQTNGGQNTMKLKIEQQEHIKCSYTTQCTCSVL
jgi:membrane protein implicated in regulation of membrane protease activity